MIDNLKKAITHAKEKATELKREAESIYIKELGHIKEVKDCLECAKEHEQLAEWLTELEERREAMEYIKKYYVLVEKSPRDNPNELIIRKAFGESEDSE